MAVRAATFTGFDPYKLTGVRVTDRELGHGSYATVLELEYMGLKCAGKKIHEVLLRQGDDTYTVRRFEEECRLLSQIRHPNIVQFLGVHFQQRTAHVPILVMEFLPTNLTSCIEHYGILSKEISYSILHDVALGLYYLHSQTPAIIHRDLSSNNVLLTPNMTAKIADLGVARILNLTPLQVSQMTTMPGTPTFMPPEVMVANPKYNTSIDEFSYGIMMIHMFSGKLPEPQVGQIRTEHGRMIPVSEAERREVFLRAIENDHPLMDLILNCINNDPQLRPPLNKIVKRLKEMQIPASFDNRIEVLRRVEIDEKDKRNLRDLINKGGQAIEEKNQEIVALQRETECKLLEKDTEIDQVKMIHSSEVEQLQQLVMDLSTQNQLLKAENEAEVNELKSQAKLDKTHVEKIQELIENERKRSKNLQKENQRLQAANQDLQSRLHEVADSLQHENAVLHEDISLKEIDIAKSVATVSCKEVKLEAKTKALKEKDAVISEMSEQITRMRQYLEDGKRVS